MTYPPSVDQLSRRVKSTTLPHPILVEEARLAIAADDVDGFAERVRRRERRLLVPVINATGVILHTNLGRSPNAASIPAAYTNLELSLESGKRGSRQDAIGATLATVVGAESAMITNNGASAVMLALAALAGGKGVAVSRGELVEIGGGFRVPDVMAQSGARLVEVGTTNRTRLSDFQRVVDSEDIALAMSIHQSNYRIVGFTEAATVAELSTLGIPVVADIGSGLIDAATPWLDGPPPAWLANEPAAKQTLEAGADLVIFSGDKLFGSAQAGVIAGRRDLVERCGSHPLARAVRPGSMVLEAIQQTALSYLHRDGGAIPFWRLATTPLTELEERSAPYPTAIQRASIESIPGGGTLPGISMASRGFRLDGDHLDHLRSLDRPIIARVEDGHTILDLRTVWPEDDRYVMAALGELADS